MLLLGSGSSHEIKGFQVQGQLEKKKKSLITSLYCQRNLYVWLIQPIKKNCLLAMNLKNRDLLVDSNVIYHRWALHTPTPHHKQVSPLSSSKSYFPDSARIYYIQWCSSAADSSAYSRTSSRLQSEGRSTGISASSAQGGGDLWGKYYRTKKLPSPFQMAWWRFNTIIMDWSHFNQRLSGIIKHRPNHPLGPYDKKHLKLDGEQMHLLHATHQKRTRSFECGVTVKSFTPW